MKLQAAQLAQALAVQRLGAGRFRVTCGESCGGSGWHVVTIAADAAGCDCPARATCRHIKAVIDHLVLAPVEATTASGPGLVDRDVPPGDPA
jgi:hypothetical protein